MVEVLAARVVNPAREELPSEYAARLGLAYAASAPVEARRRYGQFFTPPDIARFMSGMLAHPSRSPSILDPCAGTATLACAAVETQLSAVDSMHLEVFEVDPELAGIAEASLNYASEWAKRQGKKITFTLNLGDFFDGLVSVGSAPLFSRPGRTFELAIANPPYYKLPATSTLRFPNIYAAFMAEMARQLAPGGVMVTITPRSFATGAYFARFRREFFQSVTPEKLHVFESRAAAFRNDDVLQENIILCARKARGAASNVEVSTSKGTFDLSRASTREVPAQAVVDLTERDPVLRIPGDDLDDEVMSFVRELPETIPSLGLAVSTGPVVAFRAVKYLRSEAGPSAVPLLWLSNVRYMTTEWSPSGKSAKPRYIQDTPSSRRLLVPAANHVLIRRFSAKEEYRRITAAPLFKGQVPGQFIGIENHLNYVYRPGGELSSKQIAGLAAILGSQLINRYFRIHNGHTQVNAAELRAIPLPRMSTIEQLGSFLLHEPIAEGQLEHTVITILGVPPTTAKKLLAARK